jgi:methyl-accepting chemotaxis protein
VSSFNSLRVRIGGGMATLIILGGFITLLAVRENIRMSGSVNAELRLLSESQTASNGLVRSVMKEIRAAEQYLLSPSNDARVEFLTSGDSAYYYQSQYRQLRGIPTEDRLAINNIAERQANIEVLYSLAHALVDLRRQAAALELAASARMPADTLLMELQTLAGVRSRSATTRATELQESTRQRQLFMGIGFLLVAGLGVLLTATTVRRVSGDLSRLSTVAERFGGGDLRHMEVGALPREIEPLAESMSTMSERLRSLVVAVRTESGNISSSAGDFSAMSEELAASSSEISTAMVRVSTSAEQQVEGMQAADQMLDQIRQSSNENLQEAIQLDTLGGTVQKLAGQHHTDVSAASQALLDVREFVQGTAQQVNELNRLSESITEFVDLIKQISSQTNLLALNAAIEAARAGEHGRGFAVVADEVRSLADSSAEAAEEVTKTVTHIRRQVKEVADTMQVGSDKVRGVETVAEAAAGALDDIAKSVQEIRDSARRVTTSAKENGTVVDEMTKGTSEVATAAGEHASASEEVSAAAEQQTASTEEMAAAAGDLLQGANRLAQLVEQFKTD